jgi:MYXO-CTERM domain-containing protein
VFEGITNTPFPTQVEDRTMCEAGPGPMPMPDAGGGGGGDDDPSDEQPGCCDAGPIRTSNLALALGVLGLLVLRRRRRR